MHLQSTIRMTTLKYSTAIMKYEAQDVFLEIDVKVTPANRGIIFYTYATTYLPFVGFLHIIAL